MPLTDASRLTTPEGITNPPIDDLLEQGQLQVALVIFAPSVPADQRLLLAAR